MTAAFPVFGVLILNRNGRKWLAPLYESLREDGYPHKRVYLVDNASDDGSVQMTLDEYPQVTVLRMPDNLGYCMAYNVAMEHAFADGCDWVSWQNNDTLVLPGWLDRMAEAAASDSRIGVMGPVFREWNGDGPNGYMRGNHAQVIAVMENATHTPIDCEWVEGSACLVKRACVEEVGPLDPWLFFYWEEADFCRRARYHGWRVVIVPGSVNRHFAGGWSAAEQANRAAANRLQSRNYYRHKLCDPFGSFLGNLARMLRLLVTNLKHSLIDSFQPRSAWAHAKSVGSVLFRLDEASAKWRRDRRGGHPPKFTEEIAALLERRPVKVLGVPRPAQVLVSFGA